MLVVIHFDRRFFMTSLVKVQIFTQFVQKYGFSHKVWLSEEKNDILSFHLCSRILVYTRIT